MSTNTETSDAKLLDLLRRQGPLSVSQIAEYQDVTATAVRQRLNRLMGQGLIQRQLDRSEEGGRASRGRPSHLYQVTEKALRQSGTNFADLASVLWQELRNVPDPEVRRGLIKRVAQAMANTYRGQIQGETLTKRMQSLCELLGQRGIEFEVVSSSPLPVLQAVDCPYPELAEQDRSICAVEKMLFAELLQDNVRLSQCRFDGHLCCQFETN